MPIVNPEIVECWADVGIGFAGSDNAEARAWTVDDDPVEPVYPGESKGSVELVFVEAILLVEWLIRPADIKPTRRHLEIAGLYDLDPLRTDLDRGRTVDSLRDRLKGDPAAREA